MSVYKPGNVWQTQEPACCISEIPFVRNLQQFQWIFTHEGQQNQNQFSTIINLYSVKISLNYICLLNWISTIQNNSKLKIRTSKKKKCLYTISGFSLHNAMEKNLSNPWSYCIMFTKWPHWVTSVLSENKMYKKGLRL